jgi:hypothetical protein
MSMARFGASLIFAAAAVVVFASSPAAEATTMTVGQTSQLVALAPPPAGQGPPYRFTTLPDEHLTFLPEAQGSSPPLWPVAYTVFAASGLDLETAPPRELTSGAVAISATATASGVSFRLLPEAKTYIMSSPMGFKNCEPRSGDNKGFDENYVGPGSVLRDPTLPGGAIMIYEAENHCPGGQYDFNFYATIGFARSADGGAAWPQPGKPVRAPILSISEPEPSSGVPPAMGDALPTALVAPSNGSNDLYVVYTDFPPPNAYATMQQPGVLRMARARLDGTNGVPQFLKWYAGGFSQPGLGGADSPIMPASGCADPRFLNWDHSQDADLSYNAYLGRYLLVFVCANYAANTAGWYFSTASSLEKQDWSTPQQIVHSPRAFCAEGNQVRQECGASCPGGATFDGWYPSLLSPPNGSGLTGQTGYIFFLNGCDATETGRQFKWTTFTISR